MENSICSKHGTKALEAIISEKQVYLCRICMFNSFDEISIFADNFDSFRERFNTSDKEYTDKIKDYEGYEKINKVLKEKLESFKLTETQFTLTETNSLRFRISLKEGVNSIYQQVVEKFESTVDNLTKQTDNLDLTLKSAKDEVEKIQKDLDEQIEFLESKEKIDEAFAKINKKLNNKLKSSNLEKYIDPALKINFKKGCGNINFRNGTPIVIATTRTGSSYWCECSEEVFEGPMFARIRINNITKKSDWSLNIGLQRANSNNTSSYYQDGVFYMCSGKITTAFQGNQGRNLQRQWNNGDEVLIKRDENNTIWFGLNNEDSMEIAYQNNVNLNVPMRLCVGFSSSMNGDNIEIIEIDS